MKKALCFIILIFIMSNIFLVEVAMAQVMKYGQLNVISEISGVKIYVDGNFKGENTVNLKEITVGSHYVRAIDANSKVLLNELVNIKEGESTTVVVSQQPGEIKVLGGEKPQEVKPAEQTEQMNSDYQLGYESGRSDAYQQGVKDGTHQSRINKSWMGWFIWIAIVIVAFSARK